MISQWRKERIFLTVKAYPSISKRHQEASCMAGLTADGQWIRLYPVHFRDLENEQKFKKYSWVEVSVKKSSDFRAESHQVDLSSIQILEEITTENHWTRRNAIILPRVKPAVYVFRDDRDVRLDTLALIKVDQIIDLEIEETPDEDFQKQVDNLNMLQQQMNFLNPQRLKPLELVPFSFRYRFLDDNQKEHRLKIVDWEIYQLYRNVCRRQDWRELIRHKYVDELSRRNLHLFVGTTHVFPRSWIIIGVYYPTSTASQENMFEI